jgi:hypothetical protein
MMWAVWLLLALVALHNVVAHVQGHGVRVKSDRVMQLRLIVAAIASVHCARHSYLFWRTSLGDIVHAWGEQVLFGLYLPLAYLLPMLQAARVGENARSLQRMAIRAADRGALATDSPVLAHLGEAAARRRQRRKKWRVRAQLLSYVLLLAACMLRAVELANNVTHDAFAICFFAFNSAVAVVLLVQVIEYLLLLQCVYSILSSLQAIRNGPAAGSESSAGNALVRQVEMQSVAAQPDHQRKLSSLREDVVTLAGHLRRHTAQTLVCYVAAFIHIISAQIDGERRSRLPHAHAHACPAHQSRACSTAPGIRSPCPLSDLVCYPPSAHRIGRRFQPRWIADAVEPLRHDLLAHRCGRRRHRLPCVARLLHLQGEARTREDEDVLSVARASSPRGVEPHQLAGC